MSKIYVVTSGDYSCYGIEGVFSTEENAQEYIAIRRDGQIEVYELDEYTRQIAERRKIYVGSITLDGVSKTYNTRMPGNESWSFEGKYTNAPRQVVLSADVLANNKKHAIKIMNEKRTEMIALDIWPTYDQAWPKGSFPNKSFTSYDAFKQHWLEVLKDRER